MLARITAVSAVAVMALAFGVATSSSSPQATQPAGAEKTLRQPPKPHVAKHKAPKLRTRPGARPRAIGLVITEIGLGDYSEPRGCTTWQRASWGWWHSCDTYVRRYGAGEFLLRDYYCWNARWQMSSYYYGIAFNYSSGQWIRTWWKPDAC
jgi:hypothetical protein